MGAKVRGSIMAVRRNPGGRPSKFTTPAALAVVADLARAGPSRPPPSPPGWGCRPSIDGLHWAAGATRGSPHGGGRRAVSAAGKTALAYHRLWASPWRSLFTGKRWF